MFPIIHGDSDFIINKICNRWRGKEWYFVGFIVPLCDDYEKYIARATEITDLQVREVDIYEDIVICWCMDSVKN